MGAVLAPSILSADFARLGADVEAIEAGGAGLVHVDVMDGRFVPNITIGVPVVAALSEVTQLPLDCHLMIEEPERYVSDFIRAGAELVSVHVEASRHLHRTVQQIHGGGAKAGVAINPATPVSALDEILPELDFVVVMSVNPGFGGQRFISSSMDKLRALRRTIDERGLDTRIEIDGGVTRDNLVEIAETGVDMVVAGSAVFGGGRPRETAEQLVRLLAETAERAGKC